MKIAVVGATGSIGREICKVLSERNININDVVAISSDSGAGKKISFGDEVFISKKISDYGFNEISVAIFATKTSVVKNFGIDIAQLGCVVVDCSSYFYDKKNAPIIASDVNMHVLQENDSPIIVNPSSVSLQIATVLDAIRKLSKIKSINVATYHSVSEYGKKAMDELYYQTKSKFIFEHIDPIIFPKQISFNCLPIVGEISEDGNSLEEKKIAYEISKILEEEFFINITCVMTPTFNSHGSALTVELEDDVDIDVVYDMLFEHESIQLLNNKKEFLTNIDCIGEDAVFVSRLRQGFDKKNVFNMWVVSDNIRKTALNAVNIAQYILNESLVASGMPC